MKRRFLLWEGLGGAVFFLAIGTGWIASLPPVSATAAVPPIAQAETEATLAALRPPKRNGSHEMRILLSAYGARGNVERLAGPALQSCALGVVASVCTLPDFAELLAIAGVPLMPTGASR